MISLAIRHWMATSFSGIALLASSLSLWESRFKQAEFKLHVSDNI